MAGKAILTAEALARLGAGELAQLLIDQAEGDAVLRRKLRLLLVGLDRPERLSAEIGNRIQKIGRSRSMLDRDQTKALAAELEDLRRQIAGRLAATQPGEAAERLWELIGIAPTIFRRLMSSEDPVVDVFTAAVADLGRISAEIPGRDPQALADRIVAALDVSRYDIILGNLIAEMSAALGPAGRAALRQRTEADLARLPRRSPRPAGRPGWEEESWEATGRRFDYVTRLTALADLDRDVDAFVAAVRAGGTERLHAADAAQRLVDAGRPEEALAFLDGMPGEGDVDLRIAAREAMGQPAVAQDLRWRHFETHLSERHLRDFLRHLPDFEDFEAEQRALSHAAAHDDAHAGLAFLVRWPDLARADRLVRERYGELDGTRYGVLRPAAEALDQRHPFAAARLYRLLAETVLKRGTVVAYTNTVVDLLSAAGSAGRVSPPDELEPHDRFVDRLRREHGRKYKFWGLFDQTL